MSFEPPDPIFCCKCSKMLVDGDPAWRSSDGTVMCGGCGVGFAVDEAMPQIRRVHAQITGEFDQLQARVDFQNIVCRALWSLLLEQCGGEEEVAKDILATQMRSLMDDEVKDPIEKKDESSDGQY